MRKSLSRVGHDHFIMAWFTAGIPLSISSRSFLITSETKDTDCDESPYFRAASPVHSALEIASLHTPNHQA